MLDLRQGLAGNHQSSFSPVSRSNDSCSTVSTWTAEFDFWGEQRTQVYDCSGYARVELRAQTQYGGGGGGDDDDDGACSPPLWTSTSPLLPSNHCYSYPSPKSRLQAIVDGRRELMEMIKDLPESSFELSLKDIVDDQHIFQADQKDTVIEERSLNFKPEVKTKQQKKKKKKKKSCKRVQMSRSESMDSGVFLLKMFFPISLGLRRTGNRSKVSPRPSMEGSEKVVNKGYWWKIRLLVMGESKNSGSSSLNGSTSGGGGRQEDVNYTPSCWSFHKKYRSSKEGGCLL